MADQPVLTLQGQTKYASSNLTGPRKSSYCRLYSSEEPVCDKQSLDMRSSNGLTHAYERFVKML
uniref:Uncharacterized protein n=1 Tax=Anguilla anguilla TaxID=7936 RepID=A0A0E9VNT8_ANGAN